MIRFGCQHCDRPVRVADAYAGRQGRCPHCGEVVDIPPLSGAIADLAAALDAEIAQACEGTSLGAVPPPPAIQEPRLDDEIDLPGAGDTLEDTVIIPAEQDTQPADTALGRHHLHAVTRSPALNPKRTFLIAAAVIVILAAAVIGYLTLYVF